MKTTNADLLFLTENLLDRVMEDGVDKDLLTRTAKGLKKDLSNRSLSSTDVRHANKNIAIVVAKLGAMK